MKSVMLKRVELTSAGFGPSDLKIKQVISEGKKQEKNNLPCTFSSRLYLGSSSLWQN